MNDLRHYTGPVRPTNHDWTALCGVMVSEGRSEDWCAGFNHAMQVMAFWLDFQQSLGREAAITGPGLTSTGMRKSNLLGRLIRGEEVRRRPCPVHQGKLVSAPWDRARAKCGCDGTGWLPND
jgi:hypothetical protein